MRKRMCLFPGMAVVLLFTILFAAGSEDPVGNFGKGVRKIYEKYRAAGIRDVSLQLYTGDRHEILNESDREQVYDDLFEWLAGHMENKVL